MKATMNHPEVNNLTAFKLPAKDLEKVSGGNTEIPHEHFVYGLTWATLTLYGFESMPDDFEEYFNHMIANESSVLLIMYKSFEGIQAMMYAKLVPLLYKHMDKSAKREILREVYNKFK